MLKQAPWDALVAPIPHKHSVSEILVKVFVGFRLGAIGQRVMRGYRTQFTLDDDSRNPISLAPQQFRNEDISLICIEARDRLIIMVVFPNVASVADGIFARNVQFVFWQGVA